MNLNKPREESVSLTLVDRKVASITVNMIRLAPLIFVFSCASQVTIRERSHQRAQSTQKSDEEMSSKSLPKEQPPLGPKKTIDSSFILVHTAPTALVAQRAALSLLGQNDQVIRERIKIGALLPLSGEMGSWGQSVRKSIEEAIQEVGHFEVEFADTAGEPTLAIKAIDTWQKSHQAVDLIIGPISPYVAVAVAQRVQWYELPWFPLGSLPQTARNSFTISWRIEAVDEGRAIGQAVCRQSPSRATLLFDDSPRSQLCMRIVRRTLRRCGVPIGQTLLVHHEDSTEVSDQVIDQTIELLRGELNPDEVLITPLRGLLLSRFASRFKTLPHHSSLTLFAGLGARSILTRSKLSSYFHSLKVLERSALTPIGVQYLKRHPHAAVIELEIFELLTWLSNTIKTEPKDTIIKSIRNQHSHQGLWGRRSVESGRLSPPKLHMYKLSRK